MENNNRIEQENLTFNQKSTVDTNTLAQYTIHVRTYTYKFTDGRAQRRNSEK